MILSQTGTVSKEPGKMEVDKALESNVFQLKM